MLAGAAKPLAARGPQPAGRPPGALPTGPTGAQRDASVGKRTLRDPGEFWHANTVPSNSTARVQRLSSTAVYPAARRTTAQTKPRLLAAACGIHCFKFKLGGLGIIT